MPSTPPLPANEQARLDALARYQIMDTRPEPRFDRITRLAATFFEAPMSGLKFVERDRMWVKSAVGCPAAEVARRIAFCAYAILSDDVFYVADATRDWRFADSPYVREAPFVRTYAAAPLISRDGYPLGCLSVAFTEARALNRSAFTVLEDLAAIAVDELELRIGEVGAGEPPAPTPGPRLADFDLRDETPPERPKRRRPANDNGD